MSSGQSCTLVVLSKQHYMATKEEIQKLLVEAIVPSSLRSSVFSQYLVKPYNNWRLTRKHLGYFEQSQGSDVNYISVLLLIYISLKNVNVQFYKKVVFVAQLVMQNNLILVKCFTVKYTVNVLRTLSCQYRLMSLSFQLAVNNIVALLY